ncbi:CBS domain-containing protein [Lewinella lacunae]|uniref:CBS domain-containing protein n=2 Tax=Neolewinella lacunae TaxID=1517758 RepID=A0A923T9N8_9BACT|nr:CBS domain-containing protein [Neolewinella lacunae]
MTTDLATVTIHTPVTVAIDLLVRHGVHHLPVLTPEGRLAGILSQSDFLKLSFPGSGLNTVSDIMTAHVAKLEPSDTVRTAANLFTLNKFHALPVLEEDKLVGIVTTLDLIRLIDQEPIRLEDYV